MKQPFLIASLVAVTALSAHAQPTPQGAKYEMTLEGIPGQNTLTLDIESWSWGANEVEPDADPKSEEAGKRKKPDNGIHYVYLVIEQGPTSAMLLQTLLAKKLLPKVSLHSTGTGKSFELAMKDVKMTSYQTGGSGGFGRNPMDQMAMSFKTAKLTIGDGTTSHSAQITGRK